MTDTNAYLREDLSVDQQLALRTAAYRLAAEFDGTYGTETVERFLHASYDQFAIVNSVNHLPLLAERPQAVDRRGGTRRRRRGHHGLRRRLPPSTAALGMRTETSTTPPASP
ncbi:three-helix bundle dimerization domain-containing protein [Micromonospora sp. KC207]|uniref:three-helix bundle dimerization domain-containing protein n=1 Tax=Micromonospora sp. KC207 TaxID=2530377 RepID=UPI001FB5B122|nr:hypothetical protein [Micromonospora sp. KC207]